MPKAKKTSIKKAAETEKASTGAAAAMPSASPRKTILLVEDEMPLAHALEMKLTHEGYAITTAANGVEALAEAKKGKYDLILLDLIMPMLDGFSVLTELKDRKVKTPVIVLSNLGQEEDRVKAKQLGAVDYFVKSNTPIAEIVSRIRQIP